jgi:hypothetical protein
MTWAHDFAGIETQYDSEGLMGRGLYIGKHAAEVRPELRQIKICGVGSNEPRDANYERRVALRNILPLSTREGLPSLEKPLPALSQRC